MVITEGSDSAARRSDKRAAGLWHSVALPFAILFLTLLFFNTAVEPLSATLDSSAQGLFEYYTAREFQYGHNAVHAVGPFGFAIYHIGYAGALFFQRVALNLLIKGIYAWILIETFRRSNHRILVLLMLLSLTLFGSRMQDDWMVDVALLLGGLLLVRQIESAACLWKPTLISGFIGFCCLLKGSNLVRALFLILLIASICALRKQWAFLLRFCIGFAAAILLAWFCAGQSLVSLVPYFYRALVFASTYNEAAALPAHSIAILACGVFAALLIAVSIMGYAFSRVRETSSLPVAGILAVFSFLQWKHGFVRADGHVQSLFHYGLFIVFLIPVALSSRADAGEMCPNSFASRWRLASFWIGAAVFAICLTGAQLESFQRLVPLEVPREMQRRLTRNLHVLASPLAYESALRKALQRNEHDYDMQGIRCIASNSKVDYFGTDLGTVILNKLNYDPRPIATAYQATDRSLVDLNYRFITQPSHAPTYFILGAETIDNRLLSGDDTLVLNHILWNYRPIFMERGRFLLKNRDAQQVPDLQRAGSVCARRGIWLPVPEHRTDEVLLISIDARTTALGALVSFLYRAPMCSIDTLSASGLQQKHRILLHSSRTPFIIDPVLETRQDLFDFFHVSNQPHLAKIRVQTESQREQELLAEEMTVRFWKVKRIVAPATYTFRTE